MSHLRIRPLAGILVLLCILYVLVSNIFNFSRIFSSPHSGISLSQSAIRTAYYNHTINRTHEAVIPRKIHQIYHDWSGQGGNVPHTAQWMRLRDSCINRNPGWEYKLWSTAESREFLQREYPWVLPIYDSYRYPVQRVDTLKYFIMRHYGGIYVDMDNGCLESLEPLRYYPAFVTDGIEGPLFINILGAVPHHPFYEYLTNNLWTYNLFYYPLPYLTISYNSGRWFFTSMWEKYHDRVNWMNWNLIHSAGEGADQIHASKINENQLYRVVMESRRGAEPWVFWNEGAGLTWQDWDYSMFSSIGQDAAKIIRIATAVTISLSILTPLVIWRCCCRSRKAKHNTTGGLKTVAALLTPVLSPVLGSREKRADYFIKKGHDIV
ncbi:mannosyl phosphorylinositol ceramide synthase CSH1, putative [Talaromyces stipitatus ATCC 10500]|uniref:Mannosyl phosphorylinositol ceramide synthase CSH1, putative n=1 Tax=Talaromyces stipitatus (strain ATCC 10500 / CBS 375.48 / QM 6759 / NRRL 1006) TaxID=441959 RepID=B8M430_TALSN|nr:mannosyl phosphorylinositol ceramide synthase CSH1, putative [Talaromyces stipitatus ATCC 10500]EED20773.1 mannosyl phosphorylinositol ceramide synthase CSH1, putative [Talaromyces stipitatus ATCC 10500]